MFKAKRDLIVKNSCKKEVMDCHPEILGQIHLVVNQISLHVFATLFICPGYYSYLFQLAFYCCFVWLHGSEHAG